MKWHLRVVAFALRGIWVGGICVARQSFIIIWVARQTFLIIRVARQSFSIICIRFNRTVLIFDQSHTCLVSLYEQTTGLLSHMNLNLFPLRSFVLIIVVLVLSNIHTRNILSPKTI